MALIGVSLWTLALGSPAGSAFSPPVSNLSQLSRILDGQCNPHNKCYYGEGECPVGDHKILSSGDPDPDTEDQAEPCNSGGHSCGTHQCLAEEEEQQLATAFATGPVSDIRALMAEYADRIQVNIDRGAVQIYDCGGSVALQVPLDDSRLMVLALE